MRFIRRTLLLAMLAAGGVVAYNTWSEHNWPLRAKAATLDAERAQQQAGSLATRAAAKVSVAADKVGDRVSDSALTAKIKSKMALDDHVNARAINVDTSASVVTLHGNVASKYQRDRALRLARETVGVSRVVDRLQTK
jgi:hyperosmotically inducible periplasmic protein